MADYAYQQESVYNLIPKEEVHIQKAPRYMSKYRPTVVLEKKSSKDPMRTMGPAKVEVPSPEKYLKKHSHESRLAEKAAQATKDLRNTVRNPAVPARADVPPMGYTTNRDFVKTATVAVPMKPKPTCVDTSKGHKQLLENSGLLPKYIKKANYGAVPEYLHKRNEEERMMQEAYDNYVREQRELGAIQYLSDEERRAVLEGLKRNWDQLHHEYQGISLVIDTMSKKFQKDRLEVAMKQLETSINLFERFKTIYIANN